MATPQWIRWIYLFPLLAFLGACGDMPSNSSNYSFQANSEDTPSGLWVLHSINRVPTSEQDPVVLRVLAPHPGQVHRLSQEIDCSGNLIAEETEEGLLYLIESRDPGCRVDFPKDSLHTEVHEILYRGVSYRLISMEDSEALRKGLELSFDSKLYVFHPVQQ